MKATEDARRYLDNAREILSQKANKQDGFYQDKKYVKMAGDTAYKGILLALDALLAEKKKGRKDVAWYKLHLGQLDKRLLNYFDAAYSALHLGMGYDGNPDAQMAQAALDRADKIIDWVGTRLGEA